MPYTVKQLASLAYVSSRTLHYYDEIGLLRPARSVGNGYRTYGEAAALRLQQILFYRELGFSLEQIKSILDKPDFELLTALTGHREALLQRAERIQTLVETVDHTIKHIRGEMKMDGKDFYTGFNEARQKEYARDAEQRWGEPAAQSQQRWEDSSRAEKNTFLQEIHEISSGLAAGMDLGIQDPAVQEWVGRWHQFINLKCYPCSLEIFETLGHMYVQDDRFKATYEKIRPGMAAFMEQAMTWYCQQSRKK